MFRRMKNETPEEKWTRLQQTVQDGILKAYPNPNRTGCPNREGISNLAARSANFDNTVEEDATWQHVTHCSPCYSEYLVEFRSRRLRKPPGTST
jgi:hypothetical protein